MKSLLIRTIVLLSVLLASATVIAVAEAERVGKSIPVPGSWIIELESEPTVQFRGGDQVRLHSANGGRASGLAATAPDVTGAARLDVQSPAVQAYSAFLDQQRDGFLSEAAATLGRPVQPAAVYRHAFNGFAARMSAEDAARLAELPGVRSVRQEVAYTLELDQGPTLIGAQAMWSGAHTSATRGEGTIIGIIDSGINWDHRYFSDNPVHTQGYVYTNPLGSQVGECSKASVSCNDKLIGVWDFTSDNNTDGLDVDGHGTHVASTAAGNAISLSVNGHQLNTSGVAPRANIISYRVCRFVEDEDEVLCNSGAILQALDQSIADGVDVVNYSIGGDPGDPWQESLPFLNVRNAGILFVTSAGNGGPGSSSISRPANAPWAFSIGSSAHRRRIGNAANVAGLTNIFVQPGTGPKLQADLTAPVIAADSVGDLLGCSSFPSGAFSGAIAFISRGDCTFEEKVNNAAAAGAQAVLIFNHLAGGDTLLMGGLEGTTIPSAIMDNEQGLQALDAIASTSNPSATLFADDTVVINLAWQDRMSDFSSRGPAIGAPGIMKPNVTAPGQFILAGWVPDDGDSNPNQFNIVSGTSMASPHVAGAAALLKSAHPGWTPAMIQSALETTAQADPVTSAGQPATMLDRGAGRVRVDRAARAGLYLPITGSDFLGANPSAGGEPEQLNLAGMAALGCADVCTFTRTVRAINSGSWTVNTEGELDISVSPDSFSLSAGQTQQLTIEVSVGVTGSGDLLEGSVVLVPSSGNMVTQRLPVSVQGVFVEGPDQLNLVVQNNRGQDTLVVDVAGELVEAVFPTSPLVRPQVESFTLAQDPTPSNPYSGGTGTRTFLVDVPEGALMLYAETVASDAPDIDLYVGRDDNGDGVAQASEEVCESESDDALERCIVKLPEPGQWWVLVQNRDASSSTALDSVVLELAVLSEAQDTSLVVSGPASHPGGFLEVPVYWDQPAMKRGERWLGAIGVSSTADELANAGVTPVSIRRTFSKSAQPTALYAGTTTPAVVAAQGSDNLLYFDVPPSAGSVSVHVQGDAGVSAELRRMDFDDVVASSPGTPPAAGDFVVSGSGSTAGFTMNAGGQAGRWYVVLNSVNSNEALVNITVEFTESQAVQSQRGLWSPRDRVINQGIEWQRAGPGFITWYSYDADGLPVFYQAIAEIDTGTSVWRAPMHRITNATGERQVADLVGEMSLTMIDDDLMMFAWRLEGFHGSDLMSPDAAQTCPEDNGQPLNVGGHWYSPGNLVGGTTMIVTDFVQAHIRYYFDNDGVGRWLYASDPEDDPLNEVLDLYDFRGFCPGCPETAISYHLVGVYSRTFNSQSAGNETLNFESAEPLEHEISISVPVEKLSEPMTCQ